MINLDSVIIGGGPAGMAAAIGLHDHGVTNFCILESNGSLGGILNQCIHNGFGVSVFRQELTGPEFAQRMVEEIQNREIPFHLNSDVLEISSDKKLKVISPEFSLEIIHAKSIILSTGCYERTREAVQIPGSRCSGVYTAGLVQEMVNLEGRIPGKKVVILGSGDIGLIMARRLVLEGLTVIGVYEINDSPSGLNRNLVQCLQDYEIPLNLSSTVTKIEGEGRLRAVEISRVDQHLRPIPGTQEVIACDTLVLSLGLIPDISLLDHLNISRHERFGTPIIDNHMQTSVEGVYLCGNAAYVHDLVDNVYNESYLAGKACASYIKGEEDPEQCVRKIVEGKGISRVFPNVIRRRDADYHIYFRVNRDFRQRNVQIKTSSNVVIFSRRFAVLNKNQFHELVLRDEAITVADDLIVEIKDNDFE